ncbi:hypothetical protein GAYE_PCTG52G1279 [Galdieria yellowstonensis]|uniref:SANTA domain-containing protein n=1 Tax=Galdieria yellowstonensis TaxID=3028027 RepID=A0AAV9I6T9_9RHOD|nr:hypothetical protein GAYE_PCTG52G1279 [Galdieria yellowstonensis]
MTTTHKKSCCRRSVEKEEAPVTVLSCWCLRWNHKKKGSIIIYGKRLVNGRVEERFWKTSSVVKAFTPVLVLTCHKSIYSLIGELNWRQSNLSPCLVRIFQHGFPPQWKSILLDKHVLEEESDMECSQNDDNIFMEEDNMYRVQRNALVTARGRNDDGRNIRDKNCGSRPSARRGQTEAEKLCHSLRYTGWRE